MGVSQILTTADDGVCGRKMQIVHAKKNFNSSKFIHIYPKKNYCCQEKSDLWKRKKGLKKGSDEDLHCHEKRYFDKIFHTSFIHGY